MHFKTYADYKAKVDKDLDLEGETIVQETEMMEYANEGIHLVETVIHDLREDYFLSEHSFSLVAGTADYDLPTNIFANKIREVQYNDGSEKYVVRRVKKLSHFLDVGDSDRYRYIIMNLSTANRFKFRLSPASRVTSSTALKMFFIRSANRVTADADIIDIPEFYMYILQVMKIRCKEKEGLDATWAAGQLEKIENNLRAVLRDKIEDEDLEIPVDPAYFDDLLFRDGE